MTEYTILGAGLAGLSSSYHIGHKDCLIFEARNHAGGHIYSHYSNGFIWDEGPHVSFTSNNYVRNLFETSVDGNLLDYPVNVSNYYKGSWIPHPAQSNLHAIPDPLRSTCLSDFLKKRENPNSQLAPKNYGEWLDQAFGNTFSKTFPSVYTRKYWTVDPEQLTTEWIGNRVYYPDVETVKNGYTKTPEKQTHYISTVRYPSVGGYMSFANLIKQNSELRFNYQVVRINLNDRLIHFANGETSKFRKLINSLPLPEFVRLANAPREVLNAAGKLSCTSLLLINVTANHSAKKPFHWMYVYDEDKLSTRINFIELLSPNNAPKGKTGIQVEVYESPHLQINRPDHEIASIVCDELKQMGLIQEIESVHTNRIQWANVIFDHARRENQEIILNWLVSFGLHREPDDLEPMTDWETKQSIELGEIILAGRFGQWKYFWTDDCVLRGRFIAESVKKY